jgi:peptidylprolyl isomerase
MADARTARSGDTVAVHYRGTLDDGKEFDSSAGREPLSFQLGSGQVIPGFDDAVEGLEVGGKITVRLAPEEAYGPRDDQLLLRFPASDAPEGLEPGNVVVLGGEQQATVVDINEDEIVLDANHPLAGQALTFALELVAIT